MLKFLKNIFKKPKPKLSLEDLELLNKHVYYFNQLSTDKKVLFVDEVALFLSHVPIYFYKTNKSRLVALLVASSAIIITFGLPFRYKNYVTRVFVVKGIVSELDKSYTTGEVRVKGSFKDLYLSEEALIQGFKNSNDKHHVGIHEFVHILDVADGNMDGILGYFMSKEIIAKWKAITSNEMDQIRLKKSTIRTYGATNVKEFLTVCSEYFFERPKKLKEEHPEIYDLLSRTFLQNPIKSYNFDVKKWFGKIPKLNRNDRCYCGSKKKYKKCCLTKSI